MGPMSAILRVFFCLLLIAASGSISAATEKAAERTTEIRGFLKLFRTDTRQAMFSHPRKRDLNGREAASISFFPSGDVSTGEFVHAKNAWRSQRFKAPL